ncbi:RagB/SusD family nutrient uptake outer membrane protein [Sinomicrobium weinanense]|uniref:RagB/SusD family nutrient uptake outer membrane protein n=1 Tax=Sinomicrobium weinanense TaxID=2842200 RepID=A0A926JUC5_9FLAO|nr:RagB/SusD family nutrient uptake outer membrane protein [Sinomicrobium weinanense]MBC9797397.1 RagB/SusD family nutrient uptake outer membrane protein [Sinomicrobium weinanense]MBU3124552.1 RagB/SusD family nutrient uptake outer membrane protein [Sinomicrobium weinanense]
MKRIYIKAFTGIALMALFQTSCSDILDEEPRSIYEPGFFQTETGIYGGVTSMYAHLRYIYGEAYYYNTCLTGTDEVTYAQSADQNFRVMDISGQGEITSTSSRADVLWGTAFSNINTASGVIENAAEVGISDDVVAEARFFRAFDYFMLVQTFGGVPLDLGTGELAFNTNPVRMSGRNTVPEVYTRAVFPDLLTAVNDLPDAGRVTGGATKTLARLYLAKAYLTYGWWLQNPNNIPTYPETGRTDPDGHDAQWYFQQAYDVAIEAINNPGPFGLEENFYDVNWAPNDRNKEILLYADHTETSEFYNGGSLTYGSGSAPDNFAGWMMTWNYTTITSSSSGTSWEPVNSVQREAEQHLGRPWTRMCPTIGAITNTFADKTSDSRYDGTFTTVYHGNWDKAGISGSLYNANFMEVNPGDAILTFLNEESSEAIDYPGSEGNSNIGAGVLPGRSDFVIAPGGISRIVYPGLWKLGPYRTDNGNGLGEPNAGSTRPFNIAKFSELYFIAAEAAVKGASGTRSARDLINVIRARAGMWRWDNNGNEEKIEDHSADMIAATPSAIDINYILAERSREYYGEGYRWYDLVRTQKWEELAGTYEIGGSNYGDHTPQTVTRNIEPYHYLRPIPQSQLDAMEGNTETYQNPGYE